MYNSNNNDQCQNNNTNLTEQEIFDSFEMGSNLKKGDKVIVAMSGGVDSSVTAVVLHKMGFHVIGVTLRLYNSTEKVSCSTRTCCVISDINDAKNIADQTGFQHYTLGYESIFKQEVIDYFVDSYMKGETPIPCVKCNQTVKFKDLLNFAKKVNAKALFTGHYLRRIEKNNRVEMHIAKDDMKDQTYFLFGTTYDQLEYVRFPLGNIQKHKVREYAKFYDISVANKLDSQDICFVPNGNYSEFVVKMNPAAMKHGNILYIDGKIIGKHDGIIKYTIGQRKGIKVAHHLPLYVIKINPDKNTIIVGEKKYLDIVKITIKDINIITAPNEQIPEEICVKVRSNQKMIPGVLCIHKNSSSQPNINDKQNDNVNNMQNINDTQNITHNNIQDNNTADLNIINNIPNITADVILTDPEPGIAPGQACVFYCGTRVIGGGWITKTNGIIDV